MQKVHIFSVFQWWHENEGGKEAQKQIKQIAITDIN